MSNWLSYMIVNWRYMFYFDNGLFYVALYLDMDLIRV